MPSSNQTNEASVKFMLALVAHLSEQLQTRGQFTQDVADEMASNIATHIQKMCGGSLIYLNKGISDQAALRHAEILSEFNGFNHQALADKYNVSKQWIYKIVQVDHLKQKKVAALAQGDLFGDSQHDN